MNEKDRLIKWLGEEMEHHLEVETMLKGYIRETMVNEKLKDYFTIEARGEALQRLSLMSVLLHIGSESAINTLCEIDKKHKSEL